MGGMSFILFFLVFLNHHPAWLTLVSSSFTKTVVLVVAIPAVYSLYKAYEMTAT